MKSNKSRPGKRVSVSNIHHTEKKDEEGAIGIRDGKSEGWRMARESGLLFACSTSWRH